MPAKEIEAEQPFWGRSIKRMLTESEARALHRRLIKEFDGHSLEQFLDSIGERITRVGTNPIAQASQLRAEFQALKAEGPVYYIGCKSKGRRSAHLGLMFISADYHPLLWEEESLKGLLIWTGGIRLTRNQGCKTAQPFLFVGGHAIRRFFTRTGEPLDPVGNGREVLNALGLSIAWSQLAVTMPVRLQDREFLLPSANHDGAFRARWRHTVDSNNKKFPIIDVRTYYHRSQLNDEERLNAEELACMAQMFMSPDKINLDSIFKRLIELSKESSAADGVRDKFREVPDR